MTEQVAPTTVELEVGVDISKFTRAVNDLARARVSSFEREISKLQRVINSANEASTAAGEDALRLTASVSHTFGIVPDETFRRTMMGMDLATEPAPVAFVEDHMGFYRAAETASMCGVPIEDIRAILDSMRTGQWSRLGETADQELRNRLNARLRGEDPGPPVNWKGLSGR